MKKKHVIIIVVAFHGLLFWLLCTIKWQKTEVAPPKVTYVYYDVMPAKKKVTPPPLAGPTTASGLADPPTMASPPPFNDKIETGTPLKP